MEQPGLVYLGGPEEVMKVLGGEDITHVRIRAAERALAINGRVKFVFNEKEEVIDSFHAPDKIIQAIGDSLRFLRVMERNDRVRSEINELMKKLGDLMK